MRQELRNAIRTVRRNLNKAASRKVAPDTAGGPPRSNTMRGIERNMRQIRNTNTATAVTGANTALSAPTTNNNFARSHTTATGTTIPTSQEIPGQTILMTWTSGDSTGSATITATSGATIDGSASKIVAHGGSVRLVYTGAAWVSY